MEDELVDIIRNVEQEKTEKGLAPVHAMFLFGYHAGGKEIG